MLTALFVFCICWLIFGCVRKSTKAVTKVIDFGADKLEKTINELEENSTGFERKADNEIQELIPDEVRVFQEMSEEDYKKYQTWHKDSLLKEAKENLDKESSLYKFYHQEIKSEVKA